MNCPKCPNGFIWPDPPAVYCPVCGWRQYQPALETVPLEPFMLIAEGHGGRPRHTMDELLAKKEIGQRIRDARVAKGWARGDLSRETCITNATIQAIEGGRSG